MSPYVETLPHTPRPPQAFVWECFSTTQVYLAAFEASEAALGAGFFPEEATALSMTLAELASQSPAGSVVSVFFSGDSWRLEQCGTRTHAARTPTVRSCDVPLSLRAYPRPTGGDLVVAHYQRDTGAAQSNTVRH
mgnify:CR=1 FL=1